MSVDPLVRNHGIAVLSSHVVVSDRNRAELILCSSASVSAAAAVEPAAAAEYTRQMAESETTSLSPLCVRYMPWGRRRRRAGQRYLHGCSARGPVMYVSAPQSPPPARAGCGRRGQCSGGRQKMPRRLQDPAPPLGLAEGGDPETPTCSSL